MWLLARSLRALQPVSDGARCHLPVGVGEERPGIGRGQRFVDLGHPPLQLCGLVGDVGFKQLADVLPTVTDRFSPLFVGDHVVAVYGPETRAFLASATACFRVPCPVSCLFLRALCAPGCVLRGCGVRRRGSWILFYVIEAVAVIAVLNTYPDDADAAVRVCWLLAGVLHPARTCTRVARCTCHSRACMFCAPVGTASTLVAVAPAATSVRVCLPQPACGVAVQCTAPACCPPGRHCSLRVPRLQGRVMHQAIPSFRSTCS